MGFLGVYDPKDIAVIVNGTIMTGFASGTFVEAEKKENSVEPKTGSKGDSAFAKINNTEGSMKLKFLSLSPSLMYLSKLADASQEFPASVTDSRTGEVVGSNRCMIMKNPKFSRSNTIDEIDIEIYMLNITYETK